MKNVQDVYPLSPMQEFMLLHAVTRPHDDVLFDQFFYELEGELDAAALEDAWKQIVERHPILRTAFVWQEVKSPVQVVRERVTVPFTTLDWSDRTPDEQRRSLGELRRADAREAFDLSRAPLLRLTLIRLEKARHWLGWASHHLLMDRWCLGTVLTELGELYGALRRGRTAALPAPPPYRGYIAWIKQQDPTAAESFWRGRLAGLRGGGALTRKSDGARNAETVHVRLSADDSAALRAWSREHGLSLSSVVQGAWALVINAFTGAQDVVFGVSVAGRPAELEGVESIVGCFIGNLPARTRLSAQATLADTVRALQSAQHAQRRFEYVSPADLARFAGLDDSRSLFDTLLVWLAPEPAERSAGNLRLRGLSGELATAYPLTLRVDDDPGGVSMSATLGEGWEALAPLGAVLDRLRENLEQVLSGCAEQPFASLPGFRGTEVLDDLEARDTLAPAASAVAPVDSALAGGREASDAEPLREMLVAHWRTVLGHSQFAGADSFFDVGGTSILAAALHARIEASMRQSIPLLALFSKASLDAMVQALLESDWPLKPDLVFSLSRAGGRTPLFCVASPEVNTTGYALLAAHLGTDRPIHVVQGPPEAASMQRTSIRTLPELSARYVEAVLRVKSSGPYCLLGMCTGAQMALEMARQLTAAGHSVPLVCILDTYALYTVSKWRFAAYRSLQRSRYYVNRVRELLRQPRDEWVRELARVAVRNRSSAPVAAVPAPAGAAIPAARAGTQGAVPGHEPDTAAADEAEWAWLGEFGLGENDPHLPKHREPVLVLRCPRQDQWWRVPSDSLGWAGQASDVRVERIEGCVHDAVLREPHVQEVARLVANHLDTLPDSRGEAMTQ